MKKKPISRKSRALRYARLGLHVVPLHTIVAGHCSCNDGSDCSRPGKHPITRHGVKDATTKRSQIRNWWTASPNANIGIATGRESGIIVLDIDPRNGGDKNLERVKARLGSLPETVTALTGGGGRHFIFKYPAFAVRKDTSGKKFGKGMDVLSDGCIMVAPPSRHASGKRYRWKEGNSYRDLEPAKLPKAWLNRLRRNGPAESGSASPPAQRDGQVPEGQRNTHLTSLAGTLQRGGASPETIAAALIAENKAKCTPQLERSEVEKIVASIAKYPPTSLFGDGADAAERLMQQVFGGAGNVITSVPARTPDVA